MSYYNPQEIVDIAIEKGIQKVRYSLLTLIILGFIGGALISIGYLLAIRIEGTLPASWGSFSGFLGAAVFPMGLIVILLGGGELITSNMMVVFLALIDRKIKLSDLLRNWIVVTIMNFCGALFVAYFFGHFLGLTTGDYAAKTIATAAQKINATFGQKFVSGIGCNWFVALAVWLCYAAKDFSGKILGIWFPVMAFVAIGFQHVVANMFVIPAAIFDGHFTWMDFLWDAIPVYCGNVVGGAIFVGLFYYMAFKVAPSKS